MGMALWPFSPLSCPGWSSHKATIGSLVANGLKTVVCEGREELASLMASRSFQMPQTADLQASWDVRKINLTCLSCCRSVFYCLPLRAFLIKCVKIRGGGSGRRKEHSEGKEKLCLWKTVVYLLKAKHLPIINIIHILTKYWSHSQEVNKWQKIPNKDFYNSRDWIIKRKGFYS